MSSLSSPTMLLEAPIDGLASDADLLQEFVSQQDEAAFAELVKRHGGLVRGVCRRILLDPAAADDAFQHTFLSLAQHAEGLLPSVSPTASLGSWLYRVAVNASLQLKRKARSRRRTETQFAEHRPSAAPPAEPWNEVLPALDEEISALPGQYRSAVVKCHLEGKTQQDAAKELGITYATLRRRLKEARGMLRSRLSERGFIHNGFLLVPALGHLAMSDPVSAETVAAVTKTALAGSAASAGGGALGSSAGSLGWGVKFLAANGLLKPTLAGALLLSAVGGWWMSRPATPAEETPQAAITETTLAETQPEAKPTKPAVDDPFLEEHFGYVFHNGEPLSPEFQNAVKALNDSKRKSQASEEDSLKLPELQRSRSSLRLQSSREVIKSVTFDAPAPKQPDLLSQSAISQNVTKLDLANHPNDKLLLPSPNQSREPLPVEQVMDFLNEEQSRRSKTGFQQSVPASPFVLGQHTQPVKTLKAIPLY